jgi:hypothetical protein
MGRASERRRVVAAAGEQKTRPWLRLVHEMKEGPAEMEAEHSLQVLHGRGRRWVGSDREKH